MNRLIWARIIQFGSWGLALLVGFIGITLDPDGTALQVTVGLIVVILLAGGIPQFWLWRCPECDRMLPPTLGQIFCPYCGNNMRQAPSASDEEDETSETM